MTMLPAKSTISSDEEIQQLREQGFDQDQITFLMSCRDHYSSGTYVDNPPEQRRLEFVRWLYQQGKIEA
ncbi:MAG TPA: hypothetical protein VH593_32710 [Ktedonobacteraceae bacterium]